MELAAEAGILWPVAGREVLPEGRGKQEKQERKEQPQEWIRHGLGVFRVCLDVSYI